MQETSKYRNGVIRREDASLNRFIISAERDIVDVNRRLEVGNKQSRIPSRKLNNPTNFSYCNCILGVHSIS